MEKNYQVNILPANNSIFYYKGDSYFFMVSDFTRLYKIQDNVVMCLDTINRKTIEEILVYWFDDIFELRYQSQFMFKHVPSVTEGECYESIHGDKYIVIRHEDTYSLVSYPEFIVQVNYSKLTATELAAKLAKDGDVKCSTVVDFKEI